MRMKPVDYNTLQSVSKPARYIGGEVNQVVKPDGEVRARFALAFPDTYEIGMSHAGIKVLYQILNSIPGVWAQRVFAPWHDMAGALLRSGTELFSLEEKRPVRLFDVVGFSSSTSFPTPRLSECSSWPGFLCALPNAKRAIPS